MARVLFLTAEYGAGHLRAAEALQKALGQIRPSWQSMVLNFVREVSPWFDRFSQRFYLAFIRKVPSWYGWLYHLTDTGQERRYPWDRWGSKALLRICRMLQPQVVVATFPTPGRVAGEMRLCGELEVPVVMVITDHTAHAEWVHPGVDLYLVADEKVAGLLERRGVGRQRIAVTGIPIDPSFGTLPSYLQARRLCGLPKDVPVVLISGGGYGRTAFLEEICSLLARPPFPLLAVVVAGKDEEWRGKLERRFGHLSHFRILGFVENMALFMRAADCLVGKAGALTLAEAAAAGLPVIVYRALPGQEEANLAYYLEAGSAVHLTSPVLFLSLLEEVLWGRKGRAMRKAAWQVARPEAALVGAKLIAEQAESWLISSTVG